MTQLLDLAKPFSRQVVKRTPNGEDYVSHYVVCQALLAKVGPYDFRTVEVIRGHVAEIKPNPNGKSQRAKDGRPALDGAVVAVVCELGVTVDGLRVVVQEAGDCGDAHNWAHDGERLKNATSDALKRCAMRLGLGLHLWAQDEFFLYEILSQREGGDAAGDQASSASSGGSRSAAGGDQPSIDTGEGEGSSSPDPAFVCPGCGEDVRVGNGSIKKIDGQRFHEEHYSPVDAARKAMAP